MQRDSPLEHQLRPLAGVTEAMGPSRFTRRTLLERSAVAGSALAVTGVAAPYGKLVTRALAAPSHGVWLPGDLHTHSVYSHDVYGGPTDDNTGPTRPIRSGFRSPASSR